MEFYSRWCKYMSCRLKTLLLAVLFSLQIGLPSQALGEKAGDWGDHPESMRPRLGLALGGGAVRGAAHIGVLRVLEQEKIRPDVITGTSMGAIVGGLYSAGVSPDKIEEELVGHNLFGSIISAPPAVQLSAQPFIHIGRAAAGNHLYPGLYDAWRLAKRVDHLVPEGKSKIENLPIKFAAVAVDMISGEQELMQNGDLGLALQASSAIPMVCRPVRHKRALLVDGGTLNNLPVEEARRLGADLVLAVDVVEPPQKVDESEIRSCWTYGNRVIGLNLWRMEEAQRKSADLLISPSMSNIQYSSRDAKDIKAAVAAGEAAARAALPQIRKQLADWRLRTASAGLE